MNREHRSIHLIDPTGHKLGSESREFIELWNECVRKAYDRKRHCIRVSAGFYILFDGHKLHEIYHSQELAGSAKWMTRDSRDYQSYSDPMVTKREIVTMLLGGK